jgi:hypothetical protein
MHSEFVIVGSYRTAIEAHTAKHFLEHNGIRAFVLDEHTSTEGWWNDTEVKLQVPITDAERAATLLATRK